MIYIGQYELASESEIIKELIKYDVKGDNRNVVKCFTEISTEPTYLQKIYSSLPSRHTTLYMLFKNNDVAYIGITSDPNRFLVHKRDKDFDRAFIYVIDSDLKFSIEQIFLYNIKTLYNWCKSSAYSNYRVYDIETYRALLFSKNALSRNCAESEFAQSACNSIDAIIKKMSDLKQSIIDKKKFKLPKQNIKYKI